MGGGTKIRVFLHFEKGSRRGAGAAGNWGPWLPDGVFVPGAVVVALGVGVQWWCPELHRGAGNRKWVRLRNPEIRGLWGEAGFLRLFGPEARAVGEGWVGRLDLRRPDPFLPDARRWAKAGLRQGLRATGRGQNGRLFPRRLRSKANPEPAHGRFLRLTDGWDPKKV